MSTRSHLWIAIQIDLDGVLVDSALVDNKGSAICSAIDMATKERFGPEGPFPIDEVSAFQRRAEDHLADHGVFHDGTHTFYITQPRRIWG